jgi:hypothetical protein
LSTADLRNYRTEFHETWWSYRYIFRNVLFKCIIIQLEVININVRNFKFPIGFYSNPPPLWTPQNMTLTPLAKTRIKMGGKNSTLSDIIKIWYVGR